VAVTGLLSGFAVTGLLHDELRTGRRIDMAVEPVLNQFNGQSNVELEVKDLRFCP